MELLRHCAPYARALTAAPLLVVAAFCLVVLVAMLGPTPAWAAAWTERISVSSSGEEVSASSYVGGMSADGRFVVFQSTASNLVPGDTNGQGDVFVHDRQTGTTERVSVSSSGGEGNATSLAGGISADGRLVAFESEADDLVPGDTNGRWDVFVHDRQTGATERVSVSSAGEQANFGAQEPTISADGRFTAFVSVASNLVAGDSNGMGQVYLHDRQTAVTERVSVNSAGEQGNVHSHYPAISADGRLVAFMSNATNLVPGDTNGQDDVFVHDRQTGLTERVSVSSAGQQADLISVGSAFAISADGRFVAFSSEAASLVPGDTNTDWDAFVRDRQTSATERVSVGSNGEQADAGAGGAAISADGRSVAFISLSDNLVPGDTNGQRDIFVHDRRTGITERASVGATGEQGNSSTQVYGLLSGDGRYVAFTSDASNLVPGDTNGAADVFVRTRWGFRDVFSSYWAYDQITACFQAGIVAGYPDAAYRPTDPVTRAQMAVFIARGLALPTGDAAVPDPVPGTQSFADVSTDHWAYR